MSVEHQRGVSNPRPVKLAILHFLSPPRLFLPFLFHRSKARISECAYQPTRFASRLPTRFRFLESTLAVDWGAGWLATGNWQRPVFNRSFLVMRAFSVYGVQAREIEDLLSRWEIRLVRLRRRRRRRHETFGENLRRWWRGCRSRVFKTRDGERLILDPNLCNIVPLAEWTIEL